MTDERAKAPMSNGMRVALFAAAVVAVWTVGRYLETSPKSPALSAEQQAEADIRARPETALVLEGAEGNLGGFGSVFMLDGRVRNVGALAIKDPIIECSLSGASGTEIGAVEATLYQLIPGKETVGFSKLNMGFARAAGQVQGYSCGVKSAAVAF